MVLKHDLDQRAVCVDFSPDGSLLAIGLINGQLSVVHSTDFTQWAFKRDRSTCVNQVKFSPDGNLLAVGYQEAVVDLYDIAKGQALHRVGYCKAPSHSIAHMDFSADSKFLKVTTNASEVLIFNVPACTVVVHKNIIENIVWATWTEVESADVVGVWPTGWLQGEVNCADLSHMGNTITTGDDRGFVKLFSFPCPYLEAEYTQYVGHSAHVTNVKFTYDDSFLVSTGGDDTSVFVWRCTD